MIAPRSFAGIALNDGFFKSEISTPFNAEKNLILNDLLLDGQAYARSKIAVRKLTLNIVAAHLDLARLRTLNTAVAGNHLKELVLDTALGTLTAKAEVTSFGWSEDTPLISSFALSLPDPYWYAQDPETITLGALYENGVLFGPEAGVLFSDTAVVFGLGTGAASTIVNRGNVDAYPVITITGECHGLTLSNSTTGETIHLDVTLKKTDTLVLDCSVGPASTRGVYLNGVSTPALKTSAGWMHCVPGENALWFARYALQNEQQCTVTLHARWI